MNFNTRLSHVILNSSVPNLTRLETHLQSSPVLRYDIYLNVIGLTPGGSSTDLYRGINDMKKSISLELG